MSGKSISFDNKNIKKSDFYKNKKIFKIEDINVNKIFVSKKESYGAKNANKYFIGYSDNNEIKPICIRLPQMIGYAKYFDDNKTMSFKVTDKQLLKKYNKIWKKVEELLNVKFESKPVYSDDDKYIKTQIKSDRDKVNTNFQGKKVPKENSSYECLSVIILKCIICVNKKYYPQTLLEECFCFCFYLLQISFYIYLLLVSLISLYYFYNNLLLYLIPHLCFFDDKLN